VLAEVKLGSSELADADTQIRLGKVLASRLMVSGTLTSQGGGLSGGRARDRHRNQPIGHGAHGTQHGGPHPTQLAAAMAQAMARTVQDKYPLKGRVVAVDGERAIINLGKKHGLAVGQAFNVLARGEPIELNGRVLGYRETRSAPGHHHRSRRRLAYGRIAELKAPLEKNQRVVARKE
jgi:hypothetical protein